MSRREYGEGSLYWDESRQRWRAAVVIGYDGRGKRMRKTVTAKTKTEARKKLAQLVRDKKDGLDLSRGSYTIAQASEDWLKMDISHNAPSTRAKLANHVHTHIVPHLGRYVVDDLKPNHVDQWLKSLRKDLSTSTLRRIREVLARIIRFAMAQDLARRDVTQLVRVPSGRSGRPSKSLTLAQARAVVQDTQDHWMYPYIVVSLFTGIRTEEVRGIRWEDTHLDATPPHMWVWRSVRTTGDTKTRKSRRTVALPKCAVEVLATQRANQAAWRAAAGSQWADSGLVFTTRVGTALDAANVRRSFRAALASVDGLNPQEWTPRELRHSFVSILSDHGVPIEEISRLVGHSGTNVTETVYRHQLRPVIETGATAMDGIFTDMGDNS